MTITDAQNFCCHNLCKYYFVITLVLCKCLYNWTRVLWINNVHFHYHVQCLWNYLNRNDRFPHSNFSATPISKNNVRQSYKQMIKKSLVNLKYAILHPLIKMSTFLFIRYTSSNKDNKKNTAWQNNLIVHRKSRNVLDSLVMPPYKHIEKWNRVIHQWSGSDDAMSVRMTWSKWRVSGFYDLIETCTTDPRFFRLGCTVVLQSSQREDRVWVFGTRTGV